MRLPLHCRLLFVILLLAPSLAAQNPPPSFLAYVRVIHIDMVHNDGIDACVIVGEDGQYRFELAPPVGHGTLANSRVWRGYLPAQTLARFKSMVEAPALRELTSSEPRGSLLPERSGETVSLRIHRAGKTQEIVITSVDGRNPMLPAVQAFVPWMKSLRKSLGRPDRHAKPRNCSGLDLTPDFTPELQKR